MRTSTKFISDISAPTISTSFDFHDLVKGRFSDVYRFMSRHSSDHYVLFCHDHDPLSHVGIDEDDVYKDRFLAI